MSCQRNASCGVSAWVNVIQQQAQVFFVGFFFFSSLAARVFLLPQYCAAFWKPARKVVWISKLKGKGIFFILLQRLMGREQEPAPRGIEMYPNRVCCPPAAPCLAQMLQHRHISAKTSAVKMGLQQCLRQLCLKRLVSLLKPVWWCKLGPGASKVFV